MIKADTLTVCGWLYGVRCQPAHLETGMFFVLKIDALFVGQSFRYMNRLNI